MPTSAIIPLHLILCTNIFNGYSDSPITLGTLGGNNHNLIMITPKSDAPTMIKQL
jgi:hypothetical protein